ncbi:phage antirepressor KilAC domain-containing protein [Elizabethkingia anophelis]|nr:phage antirepressor KilAC domain-containing protein [Elizabethkingia anophelis]MDV3751208.1 hypothetical protein [Elizabethkingia anophelis]
MDLQLFNYNGNNVSFRKESDSVFVNATEMAKPFNKRPNDYFNLIATKELITAITIKNGIAENQLVITERGGLNPGTWLNEDLAIDFAQWLSVDFRLWVADRIKELMKYGFTATPQTLENLANNPDLLIELATALKTERAEKYRLQKENDKLKPRSEFVDMVFSSEGLLSMSKAAKALNLPYGRNTLFNMLRSKGVIFKNSTEPKQEYVNRGYFKLIEKIINPDPVNPKIETQTLVTQKGLGFIAKILGVINQPPQIIK